MRERERPNGNKPTYNERDDAERRASSAPTRSPMLGVQGHHARVHSRERVKNKKEGDKTCGVRERESARVRERRAQRLLPHHTTGADVPALRRRACARAVCTIGKHARFCRASWEGWHEALAAAADDDDEDAPPPAAYAAARPRASPSSSSCSLYSAPSAFISPPSRAAASASWSCMSDVQSVRLSRSSCMMSVLSLYDSSPSVSSSAIASSNACFARWHARSGELRIS